MPRRLCLFLLFPSLGLCQNPNRTHENRNVPQGPATSSPVQVVYVVDNSTITSYNIDSQTFEPTVAGTTAMPKAEYSRIVSSPNGQFLYYLADPTYTGEHQKLYVYQTDASGVPGDMPVQSTNASELSSLVVNPSNTFAYSVAVGKAGPTTTPFAIVRNVIGSNGALSQPVTEANYTLDNDVSGDDCFLSIMGFNPAGTTLYDEINCGSPHASGFETFNQRSVDLQTGALGPDQQVYSFSYYAASGYANIQLANNLLFAFLAFYNQGPNANLADIYQTQPPGTNPLINCSASMLAICGSYTTALAHPSGEYVFLQSTNTQSDIVQVDLVSRQLASVGTFPGGLQRLSPDGSVIYGYNPSQIQIRVAGFDAANAQVTLGGSIELPHPLYDFWGVAERY